MEKTCIAPERSIIRRGGRTRSSKNKADARTRGNPVVRPQRHLPTEVVQQIFAVFSMPLSTFNLRRFPWFLGHICSTWRHIFLSMTVEFWDSIEVEFFEWRYERPVDIIRFFVERKPEAPFSLHVIAPDHVSKYSRRAADHIRRGMKMLANNSMRWKKASFNLSPQDLLPLIHAKDRLPMLQQIDLPFLWFPSDNPLYEVFQHAPSLTIASIRSLADWKLNLLNLKKLSVDSLGSEPFAALLQMTKLEWLQLCCSPDSAISPNTIVFPNLTVLTCSVGWLHYFRTPALEDLSVDYFKNPSPNNIVPPFLSGSSCGLNILRLSMTSTGAETALEIIKCTPRITYLRLISIRNMGDVLKQLTISTNQETLARHLLSFTLYIYDADDDNMDLLFDMVSSRTVSIATDNGDCTRLQEMDVGGWLDKVSRFIKRKIAALCTERRVQHKWIEIPA